MKRSPRVRALLLVALLGIALFVSLLGARLIGYSYETSTGMHGLRFALHKASRDGDAVLVRLLLMTGADPNLAEPVAGIRPLHLAAIEGHLKIARLLLDEGAEPNGPPGMFERPLFFAARGHEQEMADLLFERGASYEFVDAVFLGDTDFVEQTLIEDPEKLHETDSYGRSLLNMAIISDRLDTARYLLELGMDPTREGSDLQGNHTALEMARWMEVEDIVDLFESYQLVSEPEIVENP